MALVELDNVVKFYGATQALGPLTLALPDGSVGLLGPNGAGKSTLIRLLLGVIPPTEGTIKVLGEEVVPGGKAQRGKIGYAPEGDAFFPDLNGIEAVAYAGQLVGMRKVDALQRAHQVLDYVELGEARYRLVETYSTGMRQRLKLAQALVHDPELLILDEPTEGVDPEARLHLLDLIGELEQEHGIKLLLSTHLLHDVERLVPNALVLNEGRAVAQGTIADLKRAQTKSFLVRVNGDWAPLAGRLTEAGVRWEPHSPNLRVELESPREILKLVAEAGLVVRHLAPVELSLEEAFEQAVARSPEVGARA
ncbi:MAG TPA: ABC transporter ATP-binding protein [Candidatus Thermoplasmatota archaeon]|jgi:ABC-2 type transport system ATP-binding protein|nr:ABC transporter ATP-binding protein [Candidatus Thermoplasmatota archaeon]